MDEQYISYAFADPQPPTITYTTDSTDLHPYGGKIYATSMLEHELEAEYDLTREQLIEMLKQHYPEKLL